MSTNDFKNNCNSCKYFSDPNNVLGSCKRYPTYQNRHTTDWCGEYSKNPSFEVIKNLVEDMTRETIIIKISEDVEKLKPKAGRPRKNAP